MGEADTEDKATGAALKNSGIELAGFYGSLIQSEVTEHSILIEDSGRGIKDLFTYDEKMSSYIGAVVSELKPVSYYTEYYRSSNNRESFKVYVRCQIPRKKAEQDIADFAKNISAPYVNLLVKQNTVHSALLMYGKILAALEQNPLHRATAYYDSPGGRVNLYEYLDLQLNTLADGITFAPLPSLRVQKTGAIETTVTVYSPLESTGVLNCAVSIYGTNAAAPLEKYILAAGDAFPLELSGSRLKIGSYMVRLELLLTEISPRIRKNPAGSFGLEITPLSASVAFAVSGDGIGEAEKNALAQALRQGIENYDVPVILQTDGAKQPGNRFTITLVLRKQPPMPPANWPLVICDLTLDFNHNGVIRESATNRFTEMYIPDVVRETRKFISENRVFFQNVARRLSQ
ncbi:MAG: hypothetical protein LBS06_07165 [Treponema sp.]|nr:hypothetical protein [Treponema sp.]